MKGMETLEDLIEEFKVRTVVWAICIFAICYFLSHTSKSMWTNMPMSILILACIRYLLYKVEFRWRIRPAPKQTYLAHLEKKQLSVNDSRISAVPTTSKWRRKIDSPVVEAAIEDFIKKILRDFVVDLWYSSITSDKEFPELTRAVILDALGEISGRLKEINLLDLLTRDMVDLIGNHLELFRRNQANIGVNVMGTLSSEERDERLKHCLMASKELHPALISTESEHKVLQQIIGGVLAIVLKPREAQCPLVRVVSRELLTSLVLQPLMNFASPGYINQLVEYIFLIMKDSNSVEEVYGASSKGPNSYHAHTIPGGIASDTETGSSGGAPMNQSISEHSHTDMSLEDSARYAHPRPADWAAVLDAATKRRSQVLAPENLENMWTKGRNYQKKSAKLSSAGTSPGSVSTPIRASSNMYAGNTEKEMMSKMYERTAVIEEKYMVNLIRESNNDSSLIAAMENSNRIAQDLMGVTFEEGHFGDGCEGHARKPARGNIRQLKRSSSTPDIETTFKGKTCEAIVTDEAYIRNSKLKERNTELVLHNDKSLHMPKMRCRVVGAYFENLGSKSFAVYSIYVTDAENKTWFVKRRYRNFERLHRHLKDIPNYSLQLPPKRFLSSSIDDYFVHRRCILLDKYLQDLLLIPNVAEHLEVWDFLSAYSKNYSFGKSTSVMKTLAVNVDDAMDDIVRQFKGVSDGFRRKVVGSSSSNGTSPPAGEKSTTLSWHEEEISKHNPRYSVNMETAHSLSDDEDHSSGPINGWHSDNELDSKSFPPRVIKPMEGATSLDSQRRNHSDKFNSIALEKFLSSKPPMASDLSPDLVGMPPEWTPANVSVPLLNLVDTIFQLNRRGWIRRQVFWISKQILQLIMEDAIDDWILRQIHWLRREEVIAQGIYWVQDVLWPDGKFFITLESRRGKMDNARCGQKPGQTTSRTFGDGDKVPGLSSFELQLEAARRASSVKKMILDGAPAALVSIIGHKQYKRSARDIYYFLQSTICLKQLGYSMLELVLVSVFPELRGLILDIHEKARAQL